MTVPGDFTKIYERYRLFEAISYHNRRAGACRYRHLLLLATMLASVTLAIVCYVLVGVQANQAEFWAVVGSIMISAALALVTATVVLDYRRQENLHKETAHELAAMRAVMPEPSAGEPEVSRWVWQTETILHGAQADPRPLRPALLAPPAD